MPFTPETFPGLQIYQSNDQHRQANSGFRPTMSETVQPALRRSSRSTQGQGGAIIQLERVGDIISLPRTRGVNPKFQSSAVQAETTDAPSVNPMAPAPKRPRKRKSKAAASVGPPSQPPPLITPAPVAPLLGHIPRLSTPSAFSQDTRMYGNPNIELTPSQPYIAPSQHQHGFDDLSIDPALRAGEQQLAPTPHRDNNAARITQPLSRSVQPVAPFAYFSSIQHQSRTASPSHLTATNIGPAGEAPRASPMPQVFQPASATSGSKHPREDNEDDDNEEDESDEGSEDNEEDYEGNEEEHQSWGINNTHVLPAPEYEEQQHSTANSREPRSAAIPQTSSIQHPDMQHDDNASLHRMEMNGLASNVLADHWQRNSAPRAPNPQVLQASIMANGIVIPVVTGSHQQGPSSLAQATCSLTSGKHRRRSRKTKRQRTAENGVDVTLESDSKVRLEDFSPVWQSIVRHAKLLHRLTLLTCNAFPTYEDGLNNACACISAAVKEYEQRNNQSVIKDDAQISVDVIKLVYQEGSTFRGEIKQAARIQVRNHCIPPPTDSRVSRTAYTTLVKKVVVDLVKRYKFLRGPPNAMGRCANFSSILLRDTCTAVLFKTGRSMGLGRVFPDVFKDGIPPRAIVLIATALRNAFEEWLDNGWYTCVPFEAKEYGPKYTKLATSLDAIMSQEHTRQFFQNMCLEWKQCGMMQMSAPNDDNDDGNESTVSIDLD